MKWKKRTKKQSGKEMEPIYHHIDMNHEKYGYEGGPTGRKTQTGQRKRESNENGASMEGNSNLFGIEGVEDIRKGREGG